MINKKSKIYVAGHKGLIGSAILRKLKFERYSNLLFRTKKQDNKIRYDNVVVPAKITLVKKDISVPQLIDVGLNGDPNDFVKPFHSGETLGWARGDV